MQFNEIKCKKMLISMERINGNMNIFHNNRRMGVVKESISTVGSHLANTFRI